MAIGTYSELQSAVGNWLARSDLASRAPEFIAIAEADFNTTLYLHWMVTRNSAFAVTDRYTTLPTDFRRMRSVTLLHTDGYRYALQYLTPEVVSTYDVGTTGGAQAKWFTVVGSEIEVTPVTSATLELIYWPLIVALSDSNTTSDLLDRHPDLYLYRAVLEGAIYMRNTALQAQVQPMYDRALALAQGSNKGNAYGTQSLTMRAL